MANRENRVKDVLLIIRADAIPLFYPRYSYPYFRSTLADTDRAKSVWPGSVGSKRGVQRCQKERNVAKEQRRGNREIRKPKAVKSAVAAPISPFALKAPSAATTTPKR